MRRFIDLIREATDPLFERAMRIEVARAYDENDRHKVVIHKNPTPSTLLALWDNSRYGMMRGLFNGSDVYWWDADKALHAGVASAMGFDPIDYHSGHETADPRRLLLSREGDGRPFLSVSSSHREHPQIAKLVSSEEIITEVADAPSHDISINDFRNYFGDNSKVVSRSGASKTGTPWELHEHIESPVYAYGVFEDGNLIAALTATTSDNPTGLQISQTVVVPERRQQGCIRYILDWMVEHRGTIKSDDNHMPEAQQMWRAIINMPGKLKVSMLNSTTGEKTALNKSNVDVPWATGSNETIILAEGRVLSESARLNRSRPSARIPVWYGPGTGTADNHNP